MTAGVVTVTLAALLIVLLAPGATCFSPLPGRVPKLKESLLHSEPMGQEYVDQMSEEEKSQMFQVMLRDLQVEGVPLLDCDADQVHTLQTALWTTMAELCDQDEEQKVCLVLSSIPMGALKLFVDDFFILKTQYPPMGQLPELERVTASILGKGVGPAIILEVTAETPQQEAPVPSKQYDEFACSAAMKSFVERVVQGNDSEASIGLGAEGVGPGEVVYRFTNSHTVCNIMAFFWNCVCEVLVTADEALPNMVLQIPSVENHARFAAITQLMSRSLCLYQGDAILSLVHFHPQYQRNEIDPVEKPAFGHLPPVSWIKPMMRAMNMDDSVLDGEEKMDLLNYQHRSPIGAVTILRNSLLGDPTVVGIVLDDGATVQASGLDTYATNAAKLAQTGEAVLQQALDAERSMASGSY